MDCHPPFLLFAEEIDGMGVSWSIAHNDIRWSYWFCLHEAFLWSLVEAELALCLAKCIRCPSLSLLWLFYWREFVHSFCLFQLLLALLKIQAQSSLLCLLFVQFRPQLFIRFEQFSDSPDAFDDPIGILMIRCPFHFLLPLNRLEHLNLQQGKFQLLLQFLLIHLQLLYFSCLQVDIDIHLIFDLACTYCILQGW